MWSPKVNHKLYRERNFHMIGWGRGRGRWANAHFCVRIRITESSTHTRRLGARTDARHRLATLIIYCWRAPRARTMIAVTLIAAVSCWSLIAAGTAKHGSYITREDHADVENGPRRYRCSTGSSSSTEDVANPEEVNTVEIVYSDVRKTRGNRS